MTHEPLRAVPPPHATQAAPPPGNHRRRRAVPGARRRLALLAAGLAVACGAALAPLALPGCGGALSLGNPGTPGGISSPLTAEDVTKIIAAAAGSLTQPLVIAVVDREGNILGLFRKNGAPDTVPVFLVGQTRTVNANELAVALARTGAFFGNDQSPLTSRTIRFISREHFPPLFGPDGRTTGVNFTPSGDLWNIESTNRGCTLSLEFNPGQDVPPARSIDGTGPGLGIATVPGGIPLYKFSKAVGGIGVCGAVGPTHEDRANLAEFAAFAGSFGAGFGLQPLPPREIFLFSVRLPIVEQDGRPFGTVGESFTDLSEIGAFVPVPDLVLPGALVAEPQDAPRLKVSEGWLVGPLSSPELRDTEVRGIITRCIARARETRAAIRLPLEAHARMVIAVGDLEGRILGLYRMEDATVFSIDVAATKARNAVYFSGFDRSPLDLPGVPLGTAVTARTLRFGSQPFFPAGIQSTTPGPFYPLLVQNYENPCTQGYQPAAPNQSGIVFFPGSAPLYRGGLVLIGGLGVSGDGVDQDDRVTGAGIVGYEAAPLIRADRITIRGVRLPYMKDPRSAGVDIISDRPGGD